MCLPHFLCVALTPPPLCLCLCALLVPSCPSQSAVPRCPVLRFPPRPLSWRLLLPAALPCPSSRTAALRPSSPPPALPCPALLQIWRVCFFLFFSPAPPSLLAYPPPCPFLLQIWRVCFFLAGLPIIWWIGSGVMWAVVWGVEKTMFTAHNALYFAYAVRRWARGGRWE